MKKVISIVLTVVMLFSMSIVAFATTNDVEDKQKELYEEYQAAVNEAIEKYNANIELKPFEEFDFEKAAPLDEFKATLEAIGESHWNNPTQKLNDANAVTPEEYEQMIEERLVQPYAFQTKTKGGTVSVGTRTITINITGRFETYYSSAHDRQLISGSSYVSNISSSLSSYTWRTTFLDERIIDGGRTFYVVAQGDVEYSGMYWYNLRVSTEFYCNANGRIS